MLAPHLDSWPEVDHWSSAFELWLKSIRTSNTRRAYRYAWRDLSRFSNKRPDQITRSDIASWVEAMHSSSCSPNTIAQRLAAISSFFSYAMRVYTVLDPTGREQPLHSLNPVSAISRPRYTPYRQSTYLTVEQARAFLSAIPRHTPQGKRDYALFLAYLVTGRRNSEIRLLRWSDFEPELFSRPFKPYNPTRQPQSVRVWYRWRGKGRSRRDECPLPVWHAILDYLNSTKRLDSIQPNDYIFLPLNSHHDRFQSSSYAKELALSSSDGGVSPLSDRTISNLVKKYARRAGLDYRRVSVHSLRHTAAMLRKQAGDDLETISSFLGHSSLAVTQIYLHQIEGRSDVGWQKVAALLGLPDSNV